MQLHDVVDVAIAGILLPRDPYIPFSELGLSCPVVAAAEASVVEATVKTKMCTVHVLITHMT